MNFDDLVIRTHAAVEQLLVEAISSRNVSANKPIQHSHERINKKFSFLSTFRNSAHNTFLTKEDVVAKYSSLFRGQSKDISNQPSRISKIVSSYLVSALESGRLTSKSQKRQVYEVYQFRSPWWVVEKILTDPEAPETSAVAKFRIRLQMMQQHGVSVSMSDSDKETSPAIVDFQSVDELYKSMQKYIARRDNIPRPSSEDQHFLACFFSQCGLLEHRLEWQVEADYKSGFPDGAENFRKLVWEKSEFRLDHAVKELPSIAEIANWVFGIPLAISGLNELINGGLRQGVGEGTVTLIRGGAGTGKTTLSISIQRAVEAIGIPTVFLSTEESKPAIEARRESVLNLAQKSYSAYSVDSAAHKIVTTISYSEQSKLEGGSPGIFAMVGEIATQLSLKDARPTGPSQFARLLLVIDGIHNYIREDDQKDIRELIKLCRLTNTHVLITSSDGWAMSEGMEYFVDNYFRLTSEPKSEPMHYVRRQISILKTRHQSSLIGDHWMQFQDEGDLLFTPNFSETLRSHAKVRASLPDKNSWSLPFVLEDDLQHRGGANTSLTDLKHFDRSVSLIYGRGSASKTALSMRLLGMPNVEGINPQRRILVLSFLAPDQYYREYADAFNRRLRGSTSWSGAQPVSVDTLYFTPGMVAPEEVYAQVSDRLQSFDIKQSGYTGLIIDGLHNIFVQFPLLEQHPELWSALLNLVRRVGIKTVMTFTDFEVWGASTLSTVDYENVRSKPLLIALSQSIDFGFSMLPANQQGVAEVLRPQQELFPAFNDPGRFFVSAFVANGQAVPSGFLTWDRATESFSRA